MGKLRNLILFTVVFSLFSCCHVRLTNYEYYLKFGEQKLYNRLIKNSIVNKDDKLEIEIINEIHSQINNYFIYFTKGNEKRLIKGAFNVNDCDKDVKWEQSIKCFVNIANFNEYVAHKNLNFTESLFISFLSYGRNHKMIESILDIDKIKSEFPIKEKTNDLYDILLINDFKQIKKDINQLEPNERICWFDDFGIIKFIFHNSNNKLEYVDTHFLGYLGNENIPW